MPSIRVVAQLSSALELDFARVIATIGAVGADVGGAEEHVLLYCIGERGRDILGAIDRLFGGSVDHWLYIADPREGALCTLAARATVCRWNLGTFPYDHSHLDPRKILDALDLEVGRLAPTHIGERVGLAIADCSAVMRWVQNAEAEVEFERTWHGHTQRIWRERLDGFPAIDVCVYQHADIDAIGLNIDQVSTALDLVRVHDRIVVLDQEGDVMTGAPAIRRILEFGAPLRNQHCSLVGHWRRSRRITRERRDPWHPWRLGSWLAHGWSARIGIIRRPSRPQEVTWSL